MISAGVDAGSRAVKVVLFDQDRATVMRLCEKHGKACTVRLTFPATIRAAHETDLLESDSRALDVSGNALEFPVTPHEIKTIKAEM